MYRNVYDPGPQTDRECCKTCRHWGKSESYCHMTERFLGGGHHCEKYERWVERKHATDDGHHVQNSGDEG